MNKGRIDPTYYMHPFLSNILPSRSSKSNQRSQEDLAILIIQWLMWLCSVIGGLMAVIGAIEDASFKITGLFVLGFGIIMMILSGFQKYTIAVILFFHGLSAFFIIDGAQRNLSANLDFLLPILIASGFLLRKRITTLIFIEQISAICILTFLGYFSWIPEQDPNTGFFYATSVSITIPLLVVAYILALILRNSLWDRIVQLSESQERLIVTLKSIGEGVVVVNPHEEIILINDSFAQWTGETSEKVQNLPFFKTFKIFTESEKKRITCLADVDTRNGICMVIGRDNRKYLCEFIKSEIKLNQELIGYVSVFRDITAKRQMLTETMKIQKIESISVLAGGIAHDFNNMLSAIVGNLSLMKLENSSDVNLTEYIDEIEQTAKNATTLTRQLLQFSKGESLIKENSSINEVLEQTANFILRSTPILLSMDLDPQIPPFQFDRGQIAQVVQNILINALQAMQNKGKITIQSIPLELTPQNVYQLHPGKYVLVSIEDSGPGIAQENILRIFDPYFTTKSEGHGLGLAICLNIIRNHGGTITVQSQLNEGTSFKFLLPIEIESDAK